MDDKLAGELQSQVRGEVIVGGDKRYDEACKVYNAMIDKRPALIAYCTDVADVMAAVGFAREHKLLLAMRGGGHNGGGLGVCDGGEDLARAAALAVLNATNRFLGGA